MNQKVKSILAQLEEVRESLLGYADTVWDSIDHRNARARTQGVQFFEDLSAKIDEFGALATSISSVVQQHAQINLFDDTASHPITAATNARVIRDLDHEQPHSIDEDVRYIRPYGFVLKGKAYKDILTWRRLYQIFCQQLAEMDQGKFASLPSDARLKSNRGNPMFSRDPKQFWYAVLITNEVYAEGQLSANSIRTNIKRLLEVYGIDSTELRLYFRQDRDAETDM